MMGRSSQYYIPSFVEIGLPVPKRRFLKGFYHTYGHGGHLGHVTSIMLTFFLHILGPESFIQNLVQNGTMVSEKIWFDFCMYTTLGQGQEMTLTFNTHIPS